MRELLHFRAQEQLCRQCAAFEPERTWHWLAEADMWKYKAQEFLSSHFADCNSIQPAASELETT